MFRSHSPNDYSSFTGSIQSNSFSTLDDVSSQASTVSRPSAKSIYLQRKEYAVSVNKMMDKFQYRVEHLFTCDLNGKELRNVADCVERLNLLDGMGRVWGQNMLLEVRGASLLLTDIETKEELESMAFTDILELKAVLDAGVFNSLLTVSVQPGGRPTTTVFMFQCEDVRADYVQKNLSEVLLRRRDEPRSSNNVGLMAGPHRNAANVPKPKEQKPAVPQMMAPDYGEDDDPETELLQPETEEPPPVYEMQPSWPPTTEEERPGPYTELDRNVDILNHILSDIEIFMGKVAAVVAKNAKKKKKKKGKKGKVVDGMPPEAEFEECLQKIKCGLNLLGELNGRIQNPGAPDLVHSLFSTLAFVVSHCPEDLPQTIVAPLLTPVCIRLMSEEASTEEDQLWQSLGDPWNIPSTQWPEDDEDIPTYTLEFTDGWQPPEVREAPEPSEPVRREQHQQPAPVSQASAKWTPPPQQPQKTRSVEAKPMRVLYDFVSRNHRELTVTKGEIVELLDKSKQWWKVRNSRGEEGFVPNNVLEAHDEQLIETGGPPVLTKKSKPVEVKAWLEDKGFSKITVRCLGGLSGSMLLGMSRQELKSVCPEEGGRVFFQLQAVKSAMATS